MERKYNEPPEGDNGGGAGLVSRARIPLTLNPRKKGFTRIPPTLADTTSRPAGHASRRRAHWRNKQEADAPNKTDKKNIIKNMKDNQQTHLKGTSQSLHYTTQRTHARLCFGERRRLSPLVPTAIGRVLVRVRVRSLIGEQWGSHNQYVDYTPPNSARYDARAHERKRAPRLATPLNKAW